MCKSVAKVVHHTCLASQIRRLGRKVTNIYDNSLRPYGLTGVQYTTLAYFILNSGNRTIDFSRDQEVSLSTLSRNIARLKAMGLIQVGPRRGRVGAIITVTAAGKGLFESAIGAWKQAQAEAQIEFETDQTRELVESVLA